MRIRRPLIALALSGALIALSAGSTLAAEPRPGCGFGDPNHAHQAAPGLDPMNLRPGATESDPNHEHTVAPGRSDVDAGDPADSPRRGC